MATSKTALIPRQWLSEPQARRILLALAVALTGVLGFVAYELAALGLPIAREAPATFDGYHFFRTLFAAAAAALVITALAKATTPACPLSASPMPTPAIGAGSLAAAAAIGATALFVVDPAAFHGHAQEDRALEWASALLLLGASAMFAVEAVRRAFSGGWRVVGAAAAGLLAMVLLVIGMEEISWGQRLFGFATPDTLAAVNWQGEFNFHNVQTDLSELIYYAGAGLFIGVLPLLRDLLPSAWLTHPLARFLPTRGVALVGAPAATFSYGHWDLQPLQFVSIAAVLALAVWARAASRRGDLGEAFAFAAAGIAVAATQLLFLALGSAMVDLPDSTEYREFFIALGFAWYALDAAAAPRRA